MSQELRHTSPQPEGDNSRLVLTDDVRQFMRENKTADLNARIVSFIGNVSPGTQRAVFSHDPTSDGWFCETFGDTWFCIRPDPPHQDQVV